MVVTRVKVSWVANGDFAKDSTPLEKLWGSEPVPYRVHLAVFAEMDGNVTEGSTLFYWNPIVKLNVDEELFKVTK